MTEDLNKQLITENEQLKVQIQELERKKWELDKKIFELKVLYEIAKETTTTQDVRSMLKIFLSMTMGTFGISKGLIVIEQDAETGWEVVTARGVDLSEEVIAAISLNSFDLFKKLTDTCLMNDESFADSPEIINTNLFSWLKSIPLHVWVPIVIDGEVIGGICVGEKISGEPFIEENLNLLSIIASNCALNVRNAKLFQENIEKERIQRENEELKRLDKKKSEFVNMVAHELRTPLTSISGFSELMIKKADTKTREALKKYSKIIFQESDRLRRIINDLLDLSRIRSGKVEMEKQIANIIEVIEMSIANVQLHAEKKQISFSEEFPESVEWFSFDKDKMTQVMLNLLSNAIKYTPDGGHVTVKISTDENFLQCAVIDTGVGIPQNDLSKIFEEFHRVNNEISRSERGTGLGLPITKSIIEAHDGKLWVESEEGKGSSFIFRIPMLKESSKEKQSETVAP